MKTNTKLSQTGHAHLIVMAVVGMALVAGIGYKVHSTQNANGIASTSLSDAVATANTNPKETCMHQLALIANFPKELALYNSAYYLPPSPADVSTNYVFQKWIQVDGQKRDTNTGIHTINNLSGKPDPVRRVNYSVVLQRHQGALATISAKASVDTQNYAASVNKLANSINGATKQITDAGNTWNGSPDSKSPSCSTLTGSRNVNVLARIRTLYLSDLRKSLSGVRKNANLASVEYRKAALAFRKPVQPTPSTQSSESRETIIGQPRHHDAQ